jgi:hypothetical protein
MSRERKDPKIRKCRRERRAGKQLDEKRKNDR